MQIGIIKERRLDEKRVAATPDTVKKFIAMGLKVNIEKGAGITAAITDQEYEEAGAIILDDAQRVLENADIVLMAIPSISFREVLRKLLPLSKPVTPIISLTKGLERETNLNKRRSNFAYCRNCNNI